MKESELDLSHPDSIEHFFPFIHEGDVKEDGGFYDFPIFEVSNIKTKVKGVLGEGVDAEGKFFLYCSRYALAIRKDIIDADGQHF